MSPEDIFEYSFSITLSLAMFGVVCWLFWKFIEGDDDGE